MSDTTTFTLRPPATPVGYYVLVDNGEFGSVRYQLTRKPSAWVRFWTRFFLGIRWEDC